MAKFTCSSCAFGKTGSEGLNCRYYDISFESERISARRKVAKRAGEFSFERDEIGGGIWKAIAAHMDEILHVESCRA